MKQHRTYEGPHTVAPLDAVYSDIHQWCFELLTDTQYFLFFPNLELSQTGDTVSGCNPDNKQSASGETQFPQKYNPQLKHWQPAVGA